MDAAATGGPGDSGSPGGGPGGPAGPAGPGGPAAEPPTVVVMTVARDEARLLPRWVGHYARQVGVDNLIVLDDNSVDGSTSGLPCTVHRLPPIPPEKRWENTRMELVSGLAQGLLACYDFVVHVDVDELLLPDPARHPDLRAFLATRRDRDVIAPMALNVLHHTRLEGDIDPARPVLGQRRFAKFVPLMCKPCIKQVPAPWRLATHGIMAPFEVDPELFLLHLKFHDREALRAVAAHRQHLVESEGRGGRSSWPTGPEEMVERLETFVGDADPETVPEFDPHQVDLASVVRAAGDGLYRTVRPGQLTAMRTQPLVRVPQRLLGLV